MSKSPNHQYETSSDSSMDVCRHALQDFQQCLLLSPDDPSILQEISSVQVCSENFLQRMFHTPKLLLSQALIRGYKTLGKQFAKSAIQSSEEEQSSTSSSLPHGLKNFSFLNEWVVSDSVHGFCAPPNSLSELNIASGTFAWKGCRGYNRSAKMGEKIDQQ